MASGRFSLGGQKRARAESQVPTSGSPRLRLKQKQLSAIDHTGDCWGQLSGNA